MEDEIEEFKQMFQSCSKLLSHYENYWEFWIVANRIMCELNIKFKCLEEEKKKCFPDD